MNKNILYQQTQNLHIYMCKTYAFVKLTNMFYTTQRKLIEKQRETYSNISF